MNDIPRVPQESLVDEEFLVIREAIALLGKSMDEGYVVREILHLLSEFLGLNRGRVILPDPAGDELHIAYAYGLTQQEIKRGRYRPGEGISGRVMESGEMVIIQDIDSEPEFLFRAVDRDRLPGETVSFIALPIQQGGHAIGVLGVHRLRDRTRPLARDQQMLKIAATLIAHVLLITQFVQERTARLESENRELKWALNKDVSTFGSFGIVGESLQLRRALKQIEQVAQTEATVLLLGESGTGKELFARALHMSSPRRDNPFVKVNCGAIPENLFESELFGYEKGAFTGATGSRPGYFEQAEGGTLFLDEVGDLPLAMQVKLLRVLQEHSIQRIGSRKEVPVNVRIVAATNQDLQALVSQGQFRLDLFYRLNVIPVRLPALRERPEDIRHLVRYYLNQLNQSYQRNVNIAHAAMEQLQQHPWPGNIRQLRNVLERLALLAEGNIITDTEVAMVLQSEAAQNPEHRAMAAVHAPAPAAHHVRAYQPVRESDRDAIESALRECNGNKSRAAQMMGMTLRQFNYRLKILGIEVPR
ncbi:GAF domain-containing protein [Parasulfuritortus cantonensis]|uniref:GAF domain-containing protein n=1 Tax=Parasulfuritortus cantonensis TaxID=2528202 RepID=A0A4R1B7C3_9PROT|nr:sigma 54-interacting transcriptional regulator [Parasulfuritortus cantonensis]TCJ11643.1 GAF domain-containing protein [Parasulfuritortus cantonensis]